MAESLHDTAWQSFLYTMKSSFDFGLVVVSCGNQIYCSMVSHGIVDSFYQGVNAFSVAEYFHPQRNSAIHR